MRRQAAGANINKLAPGPQQEAFALSRRRRRRLVSGPNKCLLAAAGLTRRPAVGAAFWARQRWRALKIKRARRSNRTPPRGGPASRARAARGQPSAERRAARPSRAPVRDATHFVCARKQTAPLIGPDHRDGGRNHFILSLSDRSLGRPLGRAGARPKRLALRAARPESESRQQSKLAPRRFKCLRAPLKFASPGRVALSSAGRAGRPPDWPAGPLGVSASRAARLSRPARARCAGGGPLGSAESKG